MKFKLQELLDIAPYQFSHEAELCQSINDLVEIFNTKRSSICESYLDERLVSAYLAFYFSTNIEKIPCALNKISPSLLLQMSTCDLIDFGAGPGPTSLAWSEFFPNYEGSIHLVEQSRSMLALAKKVHSSFSSYKKTFFHHNLKEKIEDSVLFFTHSYNELDFSYAKNLIKFQDPRFLVLIEPGTKDSFKKSLELRVLMKEEGYKVIYPCSSLDTCPIKDEDDWCHQYFKLNFDPSIERLTQLVRRDRMNSPVVFQLYARGDVALDERDRTQTIIFRNFGEKKYGFEFSICRDNKIINCLLLKKQFKKIDMDKKALRKILTPGEQVVIELGNLKNGKFLVEAIS